MVKIVPPTPNAFKMTDYYSQRPNMYTGTANVNIPLYTIDFDGWQLPLSISYNATGIRTNEEASEVGLGWALNATGIISRTVRGSDDLYEGGGIGKNIGYVYNPQEITYDMGYDFISDQGNPPFDSYYHHLASTNPDTQPDIFNYNFFGYSGSFVLSQKASSPSGVINILKIKQDACSIIFHEATKTFTIITPEGFKGAFNVNERSTIFAGSSGGISRLSCCGQEQIDILMMVNTGRFRTTTSWYLSEIVSPRNKKIRLVYELREAQPDTYTYYPAYQVGEVYSPYISNTRAFGELQQIGENETCIQTIQEHIYLDSIVSDDVNVRFFKETREDLRRNYFFAPDSSGVQASVFHRSENIKRFSGILIKGNHSSSTLNKVITIYQSYFNQGFNDNYLNNQKERELQWLRSRLDRLTIDDQVYRFSYEKGTKGLPNKLTRAIDHFGFYNGNDGILGLYPPDLVPFNSSCALSDTLLSAAVAYYRQRTERQVNFEFGKAGLLNKVVYPTFGHTAFEYEPHTYQPNEVRKFLEQGEIQTAGGARIKSIKEFDAVNQVVPSRTRVYVYAQMPVIVPIPATTTGQLMTPLLIRRLRPHFDVNNPAFPIVGCEYKYKSGALIPGNSSAEGKIIGYAKVHEIVVGVNDNYRTTYYFENRPNELLKLDNRITTNQEGNVAVKGYPDLNGHLIESRKYDAGGKIVEYEKNEDYEHYPLPEVKAITYEQGVDNNGVVSPLHIFYSFTPIQRVFITPYKITTTLASQPSGIVEDPDGSISSFGSSVNSIKLFEYDTDGERQLFIIKSEQATNSKGEIIRTEYKRANSYQYPSTTLAYMKNPTINIVSPVIEEVTKVNGQVVGATANQYVQNGTRIDLLASYAYNKSLGSFVASTDGTTFPSPYERRVDYLSYDNQNGNLLEYEAADGIANSFVWGYNTKLPIVHGIGIGYIQLNQAHSSALSNGALGSSAYETALRDNFNMVGKQITTYLHNPQVGILRVTDPSLLTKNFDYDQYGRLKRVLDNDGKTLEQYQYHFKERQPTRVLSVSGLTANGDLNFGVLTPDVYATTEFPTERCTDKLRTEILTVSNTGEDDLYVSSVSLPTTAFSLGWTSGSISPGTSVDIIVTFNCPANGTVPFGNYTGNITFSSDRTNTELISIPVNATFAQRTCNVTTNPTPILDFGNTGGSVFGVNFDVLNNGNAPIGIYGITLALNGYPTPDFSISSPTLSHHPLSPPVCINPGLANARIFQANFLYHGNSETISYMSLDVGGTSICPAGSMNNIIKLQANVVTTRTINVTTLPTTTLPAFTTPSITQNITVSNSGNAPLSVTGFTTSPANTMFSVSPSSFTVPAGGQQIVVLTFTPTAYNFAVQSTTISFMSNKTGGINSITMTGQRTSSRVIQMSANSFAFDGLTFIPQNITITNNGNDYLSITGVTNPNTAQWDATISNTPVTLTPGQSTTMAIMKKVAEPGTVNLAVLSNKNSGNEVVQVSSVSRIMGLSSTNIIFPYFTTPSLTQNVTVSNTGNATLSISSVSSSNAKFTVSPSSFNIAAGSNQVVTVTYTATDFSLQTGTITFNGNPTSGTTSLSVTAQRTSPDTMIIGISPASLALAGFTAPSVGQNITISNTGNAPLIVSGVSSTNNMFSASPNSFTVPAGGQQIVSVTLTPVAYNFNLQSTTLTFNANQTSGTNTIAVTGQRTAERTIQLSASSLVYLFTGQQQSVTVTNASSSNDYLTITGISPTSTSDWSANITTGNLTPGQSTSFTITRLTNPNPVTQNFTVASNKTAGNDVVQANANTRIIGVSNVTFPSFTATTVSQNMTVSNTGNNTLSVTNITSSNSRFSISPSSFTVPSGGNQVVTVTYTPTDFTSQATTITVISNASSGANFINTSAQRTQLAQLSLSTTQLNVRVSSQTPSALLTNTGNVAVTINAQGSNSNPGAFKITHQTYSVVIWVTASFPVTLQPGQSMNIVAETATSGNYTSASGTLTIFTINAGSYIINLSRATF